MNAQKAEHWLQDFAANTPESERTRTESAGVALLTELVELRRVRALYNEQTHRIAELEAELAATHATALAYQSGLQRLRMWAGEAVNRVGQMGILGISDDADLFDVFREAAAEAGEEDQE